MSIVVHSLVVGGSCWPRRVNTLPCMRILSHCSAFAGGSRLVYCNILVRMMSSLNVIYIMCKAIKIKSVLIEKMYCSV